MSFTFEEKDAWRAAQKQKPKWQGLYGWRAMPIFTGMTDAEKKPITLPFPQHHRKVWSHAPGTLLIGAPNRTVPKGETIDGQHYLVMKDHSLRGVTKDQFERLERLAQAPKEVAA